MHQEVRDLAELSRRDVTYNVAYLAMTWAVMAGAITLVKLHPTWVTVAVAFVVVAARQQALLNLEHECVHSHLLRTRRANERLGVLCASVVGSPFYAARARHLAHHRLLATEQDPDAELHRGPDKSTRAGLMRHFALGLLGGYAVMVLVSGSKTTVDAATRRRDRRNLVIWQLALVAALWGAVGWWAYPVLWLAPLLTLTAACHLLRNFCEHAILTEEEEGHANRLISIRSNALERFIVAPFFMNYHAEHHLFPGVPAQHLPEVQRRLSTSSLAPQRLLRGSYVGALARHVSALD